MKRAAVITIAVLIIGAAVCFFYKPIYYRLYPWDRIKGSIGVTLNGQAVYLDEDNLYIISMAGKDKYSVKSDGGILYISAKGGEYGNCIFGVDVPDFDEDIKVTVTAYNWWNVTDFDISVDIDMDGGNVVYTYNYTSIAENGETLRESGTSSDNIGDELSVCIGG